MTNQQSLQEQLDAAQKQIEQLSQELALERENAQRLLLELREQLEPQQRPSQLETETDRLEEIINASPSTAYRCSIIPPYCCHYISQNIASVIGYTPEELLASPDLWFEIIHPDDAPLVHAAIAQLFELGKLQHEYRVCHRDGHYLWVLDDMLLLQDAQGVPCEIGGYFVDISDRKALEKQNQHKIERERLLHDITQHIRQFLDLDAVLSMAVDQVRHLVQSDRTVIYRFSPDWSGSFVCESVAEPWGKIMGSELQHIWKDTCLQETQGSRFQNNEAVVIPNIYQANFPPCHIDMLEQFQVKALIVVPIFTSDRLWGLMAIYQNSNFRQWQDWELELLQQVASQLGIAIQQASLYEQVQLKLREKQQAEVILQRQLGAIESAVDGIAILENEHYLYLNQSHVQIFGYGSAAELIGKSWRLLYTPERIVQFEQDIFPILIQQHSWQGEMIGTRKDGTDFYQFLSLTLLDDNLLVCICRDITAQKQTEQQVQEQKDFIELAIQTNPSLVVYLFDVPSQSNLFASQSMISKLGYTATEIQNMGSGLITEMMHPEDQLRFTEHLERLELSQQGEVLPFEYRMRHRNGEWRWLKSRDQVYRRDSQGHVQQLLGSVLDITASKSTEANLLASETRFEAIANLVPDLLWESEPNGFTTWCNQRWLDYTGLNLEQSLGFGWKEVIHPEDRIDSILRHQEVVKAGQTLRYEYRIRRHDGKYRWFSCKISFSQDSEGEVIKLYGVVTDIHEERLSLKALQESQRKLRQSEEELRLFIKASSDVAYRMSADCQQILYIDGKDCVDTDQLEQNWFKTDILPENQSRVWATIQTAIQTKSSFEIESQVMRKDGKIGWVFSRNVPMLNEQGAIMGWFGTAQDISIRKQAELDFKELSDRMALALKVGMIGTWDWDLVNEVKWDNQMYAIYGIPKVEAYTLYQTWSNSLHPKDRDRVENLLQAALRGEADYDIEFRILRPDGTVCWIYAIAQLQVDANGKPIHMVGINQDISDRKAAEAELLRTNQELERATRLKDEFLANMSHELRTPLNAVLGMTEGLQEGVFGSINEKQLRALNTIETSSTHLLSLINDILDVAKIESGQTKLEYGYIEVERLCKSSITFLKQQATKKQIQLLAQIQPNLPDLYIDEVRIRQVLLNLLSNAVKFTPEGGTVTLTASLVLPEPNSNQPYYLRFSITDTGIGIAPENISRLFKPFIQIDSALNRKHTGTGLGLTLVKQIVELHGGKVGLTSKLGAGSCFTIDIPYPPEVVMPAALTAIAPITAHSQANISHRILLAEDNPANVATICSYLEAKGFTLICAKDGEEAINLAISQQPDLILMDIQMPNLDGLEAIRQLRQQENLRTTPIIALTALNTPSDCDRCLAAGANAYFIKPIRLKQLNNLIKDLLDVARLA
ncbi:MAG: PAS domain-containing protein [Pseudanabaenaceae cyanobacterium bins.39]|nr:PAS domain-containing protein [Pseudanabaenaceae cyanobacterium bins.39]